MIVIHIGLRKTGSTSIQKFLSVNESTLRTLGIDYSPVGQARRGNHINLFNEVRIHPNFSPRFGTLADVTVYWNKSSNHTLILSSEDFSAFKKNEVEKFKASLNSLNDDFRIVMVIRDLIDRLPSEYSQAIRNGLDTSDFDSFFEKQTRRHEIPYVETAELWANSFGWDNLRIRLLDRRHLVNGDLADDFLSVAGLDPSDADAKRLERPGIANASPSWRVQEAVRALYDGRHGLPDGHALSQSQKHGEAQRKTVGRISRKLGETRGWNTDRGRYLTADQAGECLDLYGAAVAALNQNLVEKLPEPLDLDARGFVEREFMPDAAHIPAADLRALYDDLALRVSRRHKSN